MTYALDPELAPVMADLAHSAAAAPARKRGDWRTLRETGNAGQAAMASLLPPSPGVRDRGQGSRLRLWGRRRCRP